MTQEITSTEQAIAAVEEVMAEVAPFPEKVTVCLPEDLSLLTAIDARYSITAYQRWKAHAIRSEVLMLLESRHLLTRIPDLMLVSDTGFAVRINNASHIYQVAAQDAPAR